MPPSQREGTHYFATLPLPVIHWIALVPGRRLVMAGALGRGPRTQRTETVQVLAVSGGTVLNSGDARQALMLRNDREAPTTLACAANRDGAWTWVNGPRGMEYRPNSRRFDWEANPAGLSLAPDRYGGALQPQPGAVGPTLATTQPGDCPAGTICSVALGVALTVPSNWQAARPGQEAPGVLAFYSTAMPHTRLYLSSWGPATSTDAAQAANAGMDRLLQGLPTLDRIAVQVGGAAGVEVHNVPGGPTESTAIILAHGGVLYKILLPGTTVTADQQQAVNSLRFIPRVGPFPPAN
jgi:hypothetical protein